MSTSEPSKPALARLGPAFDWAAFVEARDASRGPRALMAPGVAALSGLIGGGWVASAGWLLLICGLLLIDRQLYRGLRRRLEYGLPPREGPLLAWTGLQAAAWCAPAVLVGGAGAFGAGIAAILLAGATLHGAVGLRASPRLTLAATVPVLAALATLPLFTGPVGAETPLRLLGTSLSAAMLALFALATYRQLRAVDLKAELALSEARAARARAELKDAQKSDFLVLLSQELRAPAKALEHAAKSVPKSGLPLEIAEQVGGLVDASAVLAAVAQEVMAAAEAEPGLQHAAQRPSDLRLLMRYATEAWRGAARERWLELFLDIDPNVPDRVLVNPIRLKQSIFGLLSLALENTRHGGLRVRVRSTPLGRRRSRISIETTDEAGSEEHAPAAAISERISAAGRRAAESIGGELASVRAQGQPPLLALRFEVEIVEPPPAELIAPVTGREAA